MEKEQRNRLQKATQDARRLLEKEFAGQLLQTYDIDVEKVRWAEEPGAHLQAEQRLIREKLLAWIEHKDAQIGDRKEALLLTLREMAFTALNRFAALKLMEARELVRPCVSGGLESEGFQEFTAVAQGLLADQEGAYRLYLETIFEDVSRELRALFDPRDPASLLWPKRTALLELLEILNRPELGELWGEDETLGWVYQYFNGDAERKKMREESSAPRNSRELAVRNQFFTPRYVVEFLTDNTLGRIWYEMRQGQTGLKERCRYLVRRPDEVFLTEARSDEDRAAQSWLQSGRGERPGLWKLAHTVNGYVRAEKAGEESNRWVEERLPLIKPDKIAALTTQELLDLLFLFCRKERFCEGTLDSLKAEIDLILLTIESRVAKDSHADFPQEDLLRQPEYIPHRPLKDPREIRMLDPACGSMHFGLYAFDLYLEIYTEAWEIAQGSSEQAKQGDAFAPFVAYAADFANKAAFLHEVPRLILQHNIHGIDIDPRATQIARLTLWLRAQRAWQVQQLEVADRPPIMRSNVVCAEPMPGERELLADFVDQQFPEAERGLVQQLLEAIIDKMQLAGEAGSLLKIEEEIRDAIDQAQRQWRNLAVQQQDLFSPAELAALGQVGASLDTDLQNLTNDFWINIEERIYAALRDYADQAEAGDGFQRRLFAEDAAQGFAFIDVCRKRFDLVLMNPPFGETSEASGNYLNESYGNFSGNLFSSFLSRCQCLCLNGTMGAITDSTWLKKAEYEDLRELLLATESTIQSLIDLGWGVLDGANVATCCFTTDKNEKENGLVVAIRAVDCDLDDKEKAIISSLESFQGDVGAGSASVFVRDIRFFENFPGRAIAYETDDFLAPLFSRWKPIDPTYATTRRGYTPGNTFRFFRCWWEVPPNGRGNNWWPLNNGGSFAPVVGDGFLVALHESNWASYRPLSGFRLESEQWFGKEGLAWGKRTDFMYAYPLPAGAMFFNEGHAAFPNEDRYTWPLIAFLNSETGQTLLNLFCGQHKLAGYVAQLPSPDLGTPALQEAGRIARAIFNRTTLLRGRLEASEYFVASITPGATPHSMAKEYEELVEWYLDSLRRIDRAVAASIAKPSCTKKGELSLEHRPKTSLAKDIPNHGWFDEIISFSLGCSFGRWDIRYATGDQSAPDSLDPFTPLPICPPGQLQNAQGLPAHPEEVPAAYPVRIPWDGILVDDPHHPLDLERSVREVIAIIWSGQEGGPTAEAIEHEACEILGVQSLRDYLRKTAGFFAEHLKRYSKSRRQAPIYWQLSAGNVTYSAWLYYHRFTQDTLYRVLRDFVEPRIKQAEREQFELESQGALFGDAATRLQEAQSLLQDLRLFKGELDLVAPLWNPNLNDGVIINHAILWRVTPYNPWQKKCKECWDKLLKGDYDWAHLSFHLWPERVIKKCQSDRSLAIAHGLEERLWQETNKGNWLQRPMSEAELQALIAEHRKPAVQNALEHFLAAPPPVAAARTRAPRAAKSSSAGATRKPRGSAPAVDAEASRQTLLVLTAAPAEGLSRNAVADQLDVEAASLTPVIKQLKESGQIEQLGAARGAKYRLTEQGRAAVESQAGEDE